MAERKALWDKSSNLKRPIVDFLIGWFAVANFIVLAAGMVMAPIASWKFAYHGAIDVKAFNAGFVAAWTAALVFGPFIVLILDWKCRDD